MKTDIEYAARVMGDDLIFYDGDLYRCGIDDSPDTWQPLESDGDSRRLEIACLNKLYQTTAATIRAWEALNELRHSGKVDPDEYKRRVFALAVAIGKVISCGDAIDGGSDAQS